MYISFTEASVTRCAVHKAASARLTAKTYLALASVVALAACGGVDPDAPPGDFVPDPIEWQIVFEDNFDGNALDTSKWTVDEGDGCPDLCGWGNNELQQYSANNITVANGLLTIEARQEPGGGYTSGRINTKPVDDDGDPATPPVGGFDFEYGRVEIGARLASGQGIWPGIWLLHSDPDIYGPWPLSGEIDIVEAFNYGVVDQTVRSATHYGLEQTPNAPKEGTSSATDLAPSADINIREYAVEWEKDKLRFFVDGQHFQTQNSDNWFTYYPANADGLYDPFGAYTLGLEDAPFDQLFHLIINLAVGGDPVGPPDGSTVFPQRLEVDYVRVYECANANPSTGRGCGTADPDVIPLEDGDGGPLEDRETDQPFMEELDLYVDGAETITLTVADETGTNPLRTAIGFELDPGTVTINDPAVVLQKDEDDDPDNLVWHVAIDGVVANVLITGEGNLDDDPLLEPGFDFSGGGLGGDPVGEIRFDMQVNSVTPGSTLLFKLDSGFPNLGEVVLPESELLIGDWKTYSIKFSGENGLLANPGFVDCCGGQGVFLDNVVNPFVFEVLGAADVYFDNISITNACYVVGACNAGPRLKPLAPFTVFDDAVDPAWDNGIGAADSSDGFASYFDGALAGRRVNWTVGPDPVDAARGDVIDATFNDTGDVGVMFIQSSTGIDLSAYNAGELVFDILVTDYGAHPGLSVKVDCFDPCSSGTRPQGQVGNGVWETVRLSAASLSPLDLTNVNSGFAIEPTDQSGGLGALNFRLDNIRWEAESGLQQIDLPVTFDDPNVDYVFGDFAGPFTAIVDDPAGGPNKVALTTHFGGPFSGTVIGANGLANPIAFGASESLSIDVWSPAAGVNVLLKIEDNSFPPGQSPGFEDTAVTTVAGGWETLTFNFAGRDPAFTWDKLVLFFNTPNVGNGEEYYWDNVQVVP